MRELQAAHVLVAVCKANCKAKQRMVLRFQAAAGSVGCGAAVARDYDETKRSGAENAAGIGAAQQRCGTSQQGNGCDEEKQEQGVCLTCLCNKNPSCLKVLVFSTVINIMINAPYADLYKLVVSKITAVRCAKCANVLPRSAFYTRLTNKNGLMSYCKQCISVGVLQGNYRKSEKYKQTQKRYHDKYNAEYYQRNKESFRTYKQKTIDRQRNIDRSRYANDTQFKMKKILRGRLSCALKILTAYKSPDTMTLLGCSIDDFKKHIEQKFQAGMSWENHGKIWHVDHVLPCASFDLTVPEQQRTCFHYSNLQPLWAIDNLK